MNTLYLNSVMLLNDFESSLFDENFNAANYIFRNS